MSFRINNNIGAMGALRNLSNTSNELQKSLQRLSTGKRINTGADDPAGLIQAEGFRAQLSGINQAISNNGNAKNLAATADGALSEVNSLLGEARRLAVANGDGTLSTSQRAANQRSLADIQKSITRISQQTQFGNKMLLDGSAGVSATVTNAAKISGISFSGTFNSTAVTASGAVDYNVTTAAAQATVTGSKTYTTATVTVAAGSFTLNGSNFSFESGKTVGDVVAAINDKSGNTGVTASYTATQGIALKSVAYGSDQKIELNDSAGIVQTAAGFVSDAGVDAVASVTFSGQTVTFDKGKGLSLKDADGNAMSLTEGGNATGAVTSLAYVTANSSSFQIGGNAGQTATLSIGNYAASNLGTTAVAAKNLGNITIDTAAAATDAIKVIDEAIGQVSSGRSDIGSFIKNTVESNTRSLTVAKENLTASMSAIEDVDQAAEMTNFSKLQILQQSTMSMLAQANSLPSSVMSLLR